MNINVSDISKAVAELLRDDPALDVVKNIERSEFINDNPDHAPWIGVYRTRVKYSPLQLGQHSASWLAEISIDVIVQDGSYDSGAAAENKLEILMRDVMRVFMDNLTLKNKVDQITGFEQEYIFRPDEDEDSDKFFFQTTILTIEAEVRTG